VRRELGEGEGGGVSGAPARNRRVRLTFAHTSIPLSVTEARFIDPDRATLACPGRPRDFPRPGVADAPPLRPFRAAAARLRALSLAIFSGDISAFWHVTIFHSREWPRTVLAPHAASAHAVNMAIDMTAGRTAPRKSGKSRAPLATSSHVAVPSSIS